jgi:hypothetical protein
MSNPSDELEVADVVASIEHSPLLNEWNGLFGNGFLNPILLRVKFPECRE